jgi:steroid delta-isomerase-like uncharacterized protein
MTIDLAAFADVVNQAWNSHDAETILRLYSPEYIGDDVGQASLLHGHKDLRALVKSYWNAFPDLRFACQDCIIQDSRLVAVWVAEGTHQGTILNIPPTGHRVEVKGMSVIDVKDGLIVRGQSIWDMAGMLRHMGLLPKLSEHQLSKE